MGVVNANTKLYTSFSNDTDVTQQKFISQLDIQDETCTTSSFTRTRARQRSTYRENFFTAFWDVGVINANSGESVIRSATIYAWIYRSIRL